MHKPVSVELIGDKLERGHLGGDRGAGEARPSARARMSRASVQLRVHNRCDGWDEPPAARRRAGRRGHLVRAGHPGSDDRFHNASRQIAVGPAVRSTRESAGHRVERRRRLDAPRAACRGDARPPRVLRRRCRRQGVPRKLHVGIDDAAARGRAARLRDARRVCGGRRARRSRFSSASPRARDCRCSPRRIRRPKPRSPA